MLLHEMGLRVCQGSGWQEQCSEDLEKSYACLTGQPQWHLGVILLQGAVGVSSLELMVSVELVHLQSQAGGHMTRVPGVGGLVVSLPEPCRDHPLPHYTGPPTTQIPNQGLLETVKV